MGRWRHEAVYEEEFGECTGFGLSYFEGKFAFVLADFDFCIGRF